MAVVCMIKPTLFTLNGEICSMNDDYRDSHTAKGYGKFYDNDLFKEGTFGYEIWQKEKVILEDIVTRYTNAGRYLDFACGTGRVLSALEDYFDEAIGLDISEDMQNIAKQKIKKATLICGDATKNDQLVSGKFNCISAFRFFLNAQESLRHDALKFITNKLENENAVFIFNIHGNVYSTRWFLVAFDKILGRSKQNQMSLKQVRKMLEVHNLEIIEYHGVGFIYKVYYKFMPKVLWRFFESVFSSLPFLKNFSLYFIFVCKKRD